MDFSPSIFTSVIRRYLSEPESSLLNGMLFGTNLNQNSTFYEQIKETGLLHIVVLSGTNITILGAIIGSILSHVPKKLALIVTICVISIFVAFVGPEPPIIRAAVMGIITLLAVLYKRKSTALYSLLLAGFISAIFWPQWLTTVSFLLSYSATLGIILYGSSARSQSSFLKDNLRITLSAQLFTTPIIFLFFKQISIIAPISNLLISFTVAPIMFLGLLTSVLGNINYQLGLPPALLVYGLLKYITFVVHVCSLIPFSYIDVSD